MLEQDVVSAHARQCYASCACCLHNQCPTCTRTLLYYDLFLAAKSAPSQLCVYLHETACSGCSYMMEYTERVHRRASPPACNNYYYPVLQPAYYAVKLHWRLAFQCFIYNAMQLPMVIATSMLPDCTSHMIVHSYFAAEWVVIIPQLYRQHSPVSKHIVLWSHYLWIC